MKAPPALLVTLTWALWLGSFPVHAQDHGGSVSVREFGEFQGSVQAPVVVELTLRRERDEGVSPASPRIALRRALRLRGRAPLPDIRVVEVLNARPDGALLDMGLHEALPTSGLTEGWPNDWPDAIILRVSVAGPIELGDTIELRLRVGPRTHRVRFRAQLCFRMMGSAGVRADCVPER